MKLFRPDNFLENIYKYIDARFELTKLETQDKLIQVSIRVFQLVVVLSFAGIFILFLNFALALFLDEYLGKPYLGFLIVALLQLLFLIIFLLSNKLFPRKLKIGFHNLAYRIIKNVINKENRNEL